MTIARALEHLSRPRSGWSTIRGRTCSSRRRRGGRWPLVGRLDGTRVPSAGCDGHELCAVAPSLHRRAPRRRAGRRRGQVVLLGAGYDTRAYRFADQLAGRPVFEVDLAAISRAKAATIAKHAERVPRCQRGAGRDRLRDAGARRRPRRRRLRGRGAGVLRLGGRPHVPDVGGSQVHPGRGACPSAPMAHRSPTTCGSWSTNQVRSARPPRRPRCAQPDRGARHVRRAPRGLRGVWVATASPSSTSPRVRAPSPLRPQSQAVLDDSLYVLTAERIP